jgi:hypothetical protein
MACTFRASTVRRHTGRPAHAHERRAELAGGRHDPARTPHAARDRGSRQRPDTLVVVVEDMPPAA